VLVATGGLPLACAVNAATFTVSLLTLRTLPPGRPARTGGEPVTGALRAGLRYLARHRLLRTVLLVSLLTNLGFVGPMNVGLAIVSDERGWGSSGIGRLLAGFGAGAVLASLAMARLRWRGSVGTAVAAGAALQGFAVAGIAVAGSPWAGMVATFVAGLTSAVIGVLCGALIQARTTDSFRGRSAASAHLSPSASLRSPWQ
jgi:predicted MFS family arabinose efflux permease